MSPSAKFFELRAKPMSEIVQSRKPSRAATTSSIIRFSDFQDPSILSRKGSSSPSAAVPRYYGRRCLQYIYGTSSVKEIDQFYYFTSHCRSYDARRLVRLKVQGDRVTKFINHKSSTSQLQENVMIILQRLIVIAENSGLVLVQSSNLPRDS